MFIEGRLRLDQWQDKEGNKRSRMKVVVENFQFLGGRPQGGEGGPRDASRPAGRAAAARLPPRPALPPG